MANLHKIAIFASGSGTNAENFMHYFKDHPQISVSLVLTNNPDAGVIQKMEKLNIPVVIFNKEDFYRSDFVLNTLSKYQISFVVLAGFLWKIPSNLIIQFQNRIVNIHPALLPKFGGKGMFGHFVHEAVLAAGEQKTGISIHYVNENYDEGAVIFQKSVDIDPNSDTADLVAQKVHLLEYEFFPKIVEQLLINY